MLSCSWVDGNQLFIMKSAKNKCRKIIVMISADLISVQRRWQKWQLLLNLNTTSPEMCYGIPNCTTQTALVWFTHQLCTMHTCIIGTVSTDIWKAAETATVANVISLAFPSHTKKHFYSVPNPTCAAQVITYVQHQLRLQQTLEGGGGLVRWCLCFAAEQKKDAAASSWCLPSNSQGLREHRSSEMLCVSDPSQNTERCSVTVCETLGLAQYIFTFVIIRLCLLSPTGIQNQAIINRLPRLI